MSAWLCLLVCCRHVILTFASLTSCRSRLNLKRKKKGKSMGKSELVWQNHFHQCATAMRPSVLMFWCCTVDFLTETLSCDAQTHVKSKADTYSSITVLPDCSFFPPRSLRPTRSKRTVSFQVRTDLFFLLFVNESLLWVVTTWPERCCPGRSS